MADSATAILAGPVLRSDRRTGTAKLSGQPYDMTTVSVLAANRGVTEVTLPADLSVIGNERPEIGEVVAWVIEVTDGGAYGLRARLIEDARPFLDRLSNGEVTGPV